MAKFYQHGMLITISVLLSFLLSACQQRSGERDGYIEGEYTYISVPVAGRLDQLLVQRGASIQAHQPLFTLSLPPENSQLSAATALYQAALADLANLEKGARPSEIAALEAAVTQAQANAKLSSITLQRQQILFARNVVQKQVLDETKTQYESDTQDVLRQTANLATAKLPARADLIMAAEQKVVAAKAAVDIAQFYRQEKTGVATEAGIVNDTYYVPGEWVQPGQTILSLLFPENIFAVFYMPEEELSHVKLGDPLKITCDGCAKTIVAHINYIASHAEFTPPVLYSRNSRDKLVYRVQAQLSVADAKQLHPGQPIEVSHG